VIASAAVRLLLEAGIPGGVLHLLPGTGEAVGAPLVADPRVAGIAFTGSTETARRINLELARRPGPIVPFIAETGGQNAMIVDSSALAEQVVADVLASAFDSAGQRCSAARLLYVQADIADRLLAMLDDASEDSHGAANDPKTAEDAGIGFSLGRGYTIVWSGWDPGAPSATISSVAARAFSSAQNVAVPSVSGVVRGETS